MGLVECPGGCEHTAAEHAAFDAGLAVGEAGEDSTIPAHIEGDMQREGWLTGHAVGVSNREFKQRQAGS